ncbi:hypothetical protein Q8F55_008866 [Vanrija albida]|uniref:Uncharacterized protein n=1 Tax=Vanrija albida TaxID=181172 RepID=A0ABR3PS03_9TREE
MVPSLVANGVAWDEGVKLLELANGLRSADIWHALIPAFGKWEWVNPCGMSEGSRERLGHELYDVLVGVWANSDRFDEDGLVRTRIIYPPGKPPRLYRVATLPLMINRRKPAVA